MLNALIQKIEKEPFSHSLDVKWDPYPIESFSPSDQLKQDYLWAVCAVIRLVVCDADDSRPWPSSSDLVTLSLVRQERQVSGRRPA